MGVIGYLRVSTESQDLSKQRHVLLEYAHEQRLQIDQFIEVEISTQHSHYGQQLKSLQNSLQKGDVLIVAELSRLGRNMLETLTFINQLNEQGVKIIFVRQPELSTHGLHGHLLLAIYSYFAQAEREFIALRMRQGLAAARAQGKLLGRPKGSRNKGHPLDAYHAQLKTYLQLGLAITTIQIHIQQWLEALSQDGKSNFTLTAYQRGLRHFIHWSEHTYKEDFDPTAVLPRDLERWKTDQAKTHHVAPATINQRLVALSSFLSWCVETSLIAQNPTHRVHALRLEKRKPAGLSDTHLHRLLRAVYKRGHLRDIALIEVLVETGIRVGELLDPQVTDLIDLDKRSAYLIVRHGKYGHYRTVPLIKTVRQALNDYLAQRPDPSPFLWIGQKGSLSHPSSVLRLLDKYCLQARIDKVTPHQLRHTFATRCLHKNPADLRGLAALLGHSDLNTIMVYTEPSLLDLTRRIELLEE